MTCSPRPILMPLVALPLLVIGLLSAIGCSGGESADDERIAGVIHNLLLAAGTEGAAALESFPGSLPDDIPVEPPIYPGAELLVSNRQPAPFTDVDAASAALPQPLLYFIVLDTEDSRSDVFAFYEEALDQDPWQIQSTFSTEQLDTLQFVDVEDLDIGGVVSIARGEQGGRTGVLISLQDSGAFVEEEPAFELPRSLLLPKEFPPDIPLFEGATVTGTAFFREPGLESFLIVFLTTSSQDDVLDFYRGAFQDNGWSVQDTAAFGLEDRIDFRDSDNEVQGDVFADRFARAREYTEVSIQVQVNPARDAAEPLEDGDEPMLEPTEEIEGVVAP